MKINSINTNYNNNYSKLNFNSNINLISPAKFAKETRKIQGHINFVDEPWTSKQIKRGSHVITQEVKSCTAGGIIVENLKGIRDVVMFHLDPDKKVNKNFQEIFDTIKEKIGDSKPLQALMAGSKDDKGFLKYSGEYFDELWQKVISKFNVPTTFLKGIPMGGHEIDLYFDASNDTWLVSCSVRNTFLPSSEQLGFQEVKVSNMDKLTLN